MSLVSILGSLEIGLVFGLVALGVYLSFRVLQFPDLTVDGSFTTGAAVSATLIVAGYDPYLASAVAVVVGACAGLVTAFLNIRFGILHLLASILTMTALYTVNLRIMGKPNVALIMEPTVLDPVQGLGLPMEWMRPVYLLVAVAVFGLLLARFLTSQYGLSMRATGLNPRMARANGIATDQRVYVGMALSNGLVALGGALFAQTNGFADNTMGIGTIVIGLAAVIVGETLFSTRTILLTVVSCVIGSVLYRFAIGLALSADFLGFTASDLNLITAVLVGLALVLPKLKRDAAARRRVRADIAAESAASGSSTVAVKARTAGTPVEGDAR